MCLYCKHLEKVRFRERDDYRKSINNWKREFKALNRELSFWRRHYEEVSDEVADLRRRLDLIIQIIGE